MKLRNMLFGLLLLLSFAPIAFAASDCEHTCCDTYNGRWDDDFDNCANPQTGFDSCVSECEARVRAAGPQPINTTGFQKYEYKCGSSAILLAALVGVAVFMRMR